MSLKKIFIVVREMKSIGLEVLADSEADAIAIVSNEYKAGRITLADSVNTEQEVFYEAKELKDYVIKKQITH